MTISISQLESAFKKSWDKDTCYFKSLEDRNPQIPSTGHCTITALIVQDYFGGEIVFCSHYDHYRNRLPDGEIVDMTGDQMAEDEICCIDQIKTKEYLLNNPRAIQAKTKERYLLLKDRVARALEKIEGSILDN